MKIKAKPNKQQRTSILVKRLKKYNKELEVIKKRIAKDRDDLRNKLVDYEEIVNSTIDASDDLKDAKRYIENAIDALSKYL